MSKSRFGGLGGVMRGQADTPNAQMRGIQEEPPEDDLEDAPVDDEETDQSIAGNGKKKDDTMTDEEKAAKAKAKADAAAASAAEPDAEQQAGDDAVAKAVAAERRRIADVFASEHVKGREAAAAELLANSDMAAEGIVAMLPKLSPAATADEGAQMLDAMRDGGDADLGAGGGDPKAEENHGWGKIHEELRAERNA